MEPVFETPRLIFRHWSEADFPAFAEMNADPLVMEYYPATLNEVGSGQLYQQILTHFEQHGWGLFAAEEKESRQFVGYIGFKWATFAAYFTPCVEISWRLKAAVWGKGLATEGALACLDYGFKALALDRIYAFTALTNKRSERVMQKIGMRQIGHFHHPKVESDHPLAPHILYVKEAAPKG